MGAQSSLLALTGAITGAVAATGEIKSKISGKAGVDSQMADYARQMRDAKLQTAKYNAKMSKLQFQKMKKEVRGDK